MVIDTYSLATQGQNSFDTYAIAVMGYNQISVITDLEDNIFSVLKTKKTMSSLGINSKKSYLYTLNNNGKRSAKKSLFNIENVKSSTFTKRLCSTLNIIKKEL